ncbi:hypothetical protein E2C01_014179 [Portunus trituberculatus]|uniref:Uncharacterized protein n=1 Tax=Portunus trituberculatus TaxID=210409 RepID=A0A5B7DI36_PORTR|nr:hypothetical protein [Portunus trituberculatus]
MTSQKHITGFNYKVPGNDTGLCMQDLLQRIYISVLNTEALSYSHTLGPHQLGALGTCLCCLPHCNASDS